MALSNRSDQFGNFNYSPETGEIQRKIPKMFQKLISFMVIKRKISNLKYTCYFCIKQILVDILG